MRLLFKNHHSGEQSDLISTRAFYKEGPSGRTDVGEYQSELSKHGCRENNKKKDLKKKKKCCSDAWGPIRLPTTGAGDNAGCAPVWYNISPISWMSAWCSLDASNQGRCESQQQDDIASRWWKQQQRVCVQRESAPSLTRYVRRKEKKKNNNTYPIILSIYKQRGNAASTCGWNRS